MSMLFRAGTSSPSLVIAKAGTVADHAGQAGRYLTDGVNLYRCLGAIASGMGQMVGLENCRSLDVMLLPIGELRARRCAPSSRLAASSERASRSPRARNSAVPAHLRASGAVMARIRGQRAPVISRARSPVR